ncbi:unnamed protein product, partial [Meganyctiphanes norvegica]
SSGLGAVVGSEASTQDSSAVQGRTLWLWDPNIAGAHPEYFDSSLNLFLVWAGILAAYNYVSDIEPTAKEDKNTALGLGINVKPLVRRPPGAFSLPSNLRRDPQSKSRFTNQNNVNTRARINKQ